MLKDYLPFLVFQISLREEFMVAYESRLHSEHNLYVFTLAILQIRKTAVPWKSSFTLGVP